MQETASHVKLVGPSMGFECYNFFTPPDDPKSSKVSPTKKNQSKKAKAAGQ